MTKSMKKTSVLVVALMMLLSLSVAYAGSDVNIAIYKDGSTTASMANKAIVQGSQNLVVNGSEATLTFKIKPFKKFFITGHMTALSVDFGSGEIPASFSGDTVTFKFPASVLTDGKTSYSAKVKNDVLGFGMSNDVEFYISK
ncbi:hypothetical protein [Crassaminicella profunda]|uniref:hypothetical protein n=1 Tax=Crassaminicella profunda TaxID=1286698 RepID=UPI001CA7B009|nr:hypothetical protein [Crassaminicella profunda]QZY55871.1 hypothetical protein K7H06_02315 [Crassaminicella profunda]